MLERGESKNEKTTSSGQSSEFSDGDENRESFASRSYRFTSEEITDLNGMEDNKVVDESIIPDDYDKLLKIFRRANLIRDGARNQAHRNSFKGEDFVNFIMRERHVKRSEALELGQILIDKHFGPRMARDNPTGGLMFSTEHFYVMQDEDSNIPLNVVSMPNLCEEDLIIPVNEMNERLVTILNRLYKQILSTDRKLIFYERLEDNDNFRSYLALASDLPRLNLRLASNRELAALFINIYNMMLIHIVYKFGVHSNIWQKRKYFNSTYYLISRHRYTLQSIYNGVLRGNKKGLGMLWKPFGKTDPRRDHTMFEGNPLVHFALNTYAISTPPIRTYSADDLMREMTENAKLFLNREENLWFDAKKQTILLSKIFKWYTLDFGRTNDQVIEWIIDTLEEGFTKESLVQIYLSGQFTINYLPFNFDSNILRENCEI
ncbi:DUF547 domain-containing protein [Aphelenchoides bicaudatus]|nr:DUF547 domain-containing protein [Aphelenchoides bicaudatus]